MPAIINVFLSSSFKRSVFDIKLPTLPPICSAAPSRPADPPNKCVITEEMKISGPIRTGKCGSECIELITKSVPASLYFASLYSSTITIPPIGKKYMSHGWLTLSCVT